MKVIAMFNHKGGVAKTTSTYALAWEIAIRRRRVLMIDCDAQCNLSQLVLQSTFEERDINFGTFYDGVPAPASKQTIYTPPAQPNNMRDVFLPIIDDLPQPIPQPNFYKVKSYLYLLAGHPQITAYEEKLSVAYSSNGSLAARALAAFLELLDHLRGAHPHFDIIFLDLSPSIGPLNRHLLLLSDYFIVPCAPDYFSFEAIRSIQRTIPEWKLKDQSMRHLAVNIPAPWRNWQSVPRFVGVLLLRYTHRRQTPAKNFMKWIVNITVQVSGVAQGPVNPRPVQVLYQVNLLASPPGLIQALRLVAGRDMSFTDAQYNQIIPVPAGTEQEQYRPHNILGMISDFTQLAALSHIHSRPVNGLENRHLTSNDPVTGEAVKTSGTWLRELKARRDEWIEVFAAVVNNIMFVTNDCTI